MAGEATTVNTEETTAPTVQEVDEITGHEAFDQDDVFMGDDDKPIQAFDRAKNITYVVKGKGLIKPPDAAKPDDKDADAEALAAKAASEALAAGKKQEGKDEKVEDFINAADFVLKKTGYKKDEIDLGDGKIVKIKDLTEQQQLDIMVTEFGASQEGYEKRIKELETTQKEIVFDDPAANQIVEFLKQGGDIKKLAKEILSKDPAAQAKMLSDAEVVKLSIKKEFPTYTDEDVEEEFKEMTAAAITRRAKAGRAKMEAEKPDFSNLTKEQKEFNAAEEKRQLDEFKKEIEGVRTAASTVKDIAGIPLNDNIRGFLLKKITTENPNDDSEFVKELSSNPKALFEAQFWKTYGQKLVEKTREDYFRMGLAKGQEGKEGLSDEPIRSYNLGSGKPGQKSTASKKSVTELSGDELMKWLDESASI